MIKFSKWKVPLPGSQARRNKLLVSWGPLVIAPPLARRLLRKKKDGPPMKTIYPLLDMTGIP